MTNDSNNTKRESIIKKINLLKEKTTANGCSEAEAMTAAEMISKLLQEYDLSMTDVEIRSQVFLKEELGVKGSNKKPIHDITPAIGILTDTKTFFIRRGNLITYTFFGAKKDVDFACYLFDLLSNAMDNEYAKYKNTSEFKMIGGKSARSSFYKGMIIRLSQRLINMKEKMSNDAENAGLVLYDKMGITNEMFKKNNPFMKIKKEYSKITVSDITAFNSGKDAANRVNITPGLSGKRSDEQLRLKA